MMAITVISYFFAILHISFTSFAYQRRFHTSVANNCGWKGKINIVDSLSYSCTALRANRPSNANSRKFMDDFESIVVNGSSNRIMPAMDVFNRTLLLANKTSLDDRPIFPEMEQAGIDEKALRASPFGKVLFTVLDALFPVFKEPNW